MLVIGVCLFLNALFFSFFLVVVCVLLCFFGVSTSTPPAAGTMCLLLRVSHLASSYEYGGNVQVSFWCGFIVRGGEGGIAKQITTRTAVPTNLLAGYKSI